MVTSPITISRLFFGDLPINHVWDVTPLQSVYIYGWLRTPHLPTNVGNSLCSVLSWFYLWSVFCYAPLSSCSSPQVALCERVIALRWHYTTLTICVALNPYTTSQTHDSQCISHYSHPRAFAQGVENPSKNWSIDGPGCVCELLSFNTKRNSLLKLDE